MTTEEMKYWVAWHFHYGLKYPLVTCECLIGHYNLGDVVAVRKTIVTEVEIKQSMSEIFEDLKKKRHKHEVYLEWNDMQVAAAYPRTRPNKFYFAVPWSKDIPSRRSKIPPEFPEKYGLMTINQGGYCNVIKRARYLTRDKSQVEKIRQMVAKRLTAENLSLREKLLKNAD